MEEQILEFIHRRFPEDNHWLDGNCYWFARILCDRFLELSLWYDPIVGHFYAGDNNKLYDWEGVHEHTPVVINYYKLCHSDPIWGERLWRDCAC